MVCRETQVRAVEQQARGLPFGEVNNLPFLCRTNFRTPYDLSWERLEPSAIGQYFCVAGDDCGGETIYRMLDIAGGETLDI